MHTGKGSLNPKMFENVSFTANGGSISFLSVAAFTDTLAKPPTALYLSSVQLLLHFLLVLNT